jgi:argininosuccinate lyase
MQSTGRIKQLLHPEARAIVFDDDLRHAIGHELPCYVQIDRAHVVMLVQTGLLASSTAAAILAELDRLEADKFQELATVAAPRGSYLAYETFLRDKLGASVAGNIHLARSRNDINATAFPLQLRPLFVALAEELINTVTVLASKAGEHRETLLPLHTHRQPAVPSTLGHHLAAFAAPLSRDLDALLALRPLLLLSCLGAGAGGGTTLPINAATTARLLGFSSPAPNSIDAVAARDLALRVLAVAAVSSTNISRIAESMLIWVGEAGLLTLPDNLIGSSSAMPNKRNPFLLERAQGKAGSAIGHLMGALAIVQSAPFTNSASVGSDALSHVWPGLQAAWDGVRLLGLCAAGLEPVPDAIRKTTSFVSAQEAATVLATDGGMDFRSAHNAIGALVTEAMAHGVGSLNDALADRPIGSLADRHADLHPMQIARNARFGGGPAPETVSAHLDALTAQTNEASATLRCLQDGWNRAERELRSAVARIITSGEAKACAREQESHQEVLSDRKGESQ